MKKTIQIHGKEVELLGMREGRYIETAEGWFSITPVCFCHKPGGLDFDTSKLPLTPPKKILNIEFSEDPNIARLSDGTTIHYLPSQFYLAKHLEQVERVGCLVVYPGKRGEQLYSEELVGPYEPDWKQRVVFTDSFRVVSLLSVPPATVNLRVRHLTEALRFLYDHRESGWLSWGDVIDAAGNPAWNERSPKDHLHCRRNDEKQMVIEAIIEERGSNATGWEVKLSDKYQFEIQ